VPYLTPQDIPEGDDCRPLFIPASSEWLAFFGGALTELTKTWNWEAFGSVSVEDTVDKMAEIINTWYTEACTACETPGGYRVIRIGAGGHVEQLDDNGDWVDATDDYHIPLPEAREDGTEADQICLAAKNAVNGLQLLYENLSDSWNADLDEAEAITAIVEFFALTFGFVIAPITYGIAAFFLPIFVTMYALVEFVIADLWDENVSKQLECFLVNCATNTAGVVTFDYDCFTTNLRDNINFFDLTEDQLRLYLQISYLLYFIGGADGLNFAGGATAITDDDCSFCSDEWCVVADFSIEDYGFISACFEFPSATCDATYASGTWHDTLGSTGNGITRFCLIEIQFPQAYHFTQVNSDCYVTGTGAPMTMGSSIYANSAGGSPNASVQIPVSNDHYGALLNLDDDVDFFQFGTNVSPAGGGDAATGHSYTARITFRGTGEKPDLPDC